MDALGVDIGGVIIDRRNDGTPTSLFGDNYLTATSCPGVFDSLARLVGHFGPRVYVVSKCGRRIQDRSLEWLAHHDFYTRTGILPEHVRFCREYEGKAVIAAELGLTHHVDDLLEVMGHLVPITPHLVLYRPQASDMREHARLLPHVQVVWSWQAAEAAILG